MRVGLRFDLRAPHPAAPTSAIYGASVEMAGWADRHGFDSIVLSEHHAVPDGYCPSPLLIGAAMAAVTSRVTIEFRVLLLPLYDPVKVAEDVAVLDQLSKGRVVLVVGAGYRDAELELFGVDAAQRVARLESGVACLRAAWSPEPIEWEGRLLDTRPRPFQQPHPPILLAGSTPGSARRAARIADGYAPVDPRLFEGYVAECQRLGKRPGPREAGGGPLFLFVSDDPDRDWARIAPHARHETDSYGRWLGEAGLGGPYSSDLTDDQLRQQYWVLTPAEARTRLSAIGPEGAMSLNPLMGGLVPDLAWEGLERFTAEVLPHLRQLTPTA